ncbi:MAG: hypothetical protein WB402_06930 [Sulfuricaulis sp.]|uniref:hypothetical protein n=1 Tax=Sulfuricaulis sp. TaxID=2003553 RepID=UPI003C45B05F
MKRQVPTEREITDLIASAYERGTEPDPRRLAVIELSLLAQTRLRRGRAKFAWWWLVGALVAGTASALWWVVNYDSVERQNQPAPEVISPSEAPLTTESPVHPSRSEDADSKPAGEQDGKKGPEIYRRER